MEPVRVAALQMVSGPALGPNLEAAARLIAAAAAQGAGLAALPENFYCIGLRDTDKLAYAEPEGDGPVQRFLSAQAREHRLWLVGGTAPLAANGAGRVRGACLVHDDLGARRARYDKMHLFRFQAGEERYDETRTLEAGDTPLAVDSPFGRLALSVCYDMRFPELYRGLGAFDIAFVPSAFTVPTGAAHWETILRARAIENLAYVVAAAQGGEHPGGRRTYGHSLIAGPWGEVLAEAGSGPGVVTATLDVDYLQRLRAQFPALSHRRLATGVAAG